MGNGIKGWGQKVLFEAIIINATSEVIPERLLKSLKSLRNRKKEIEDTLKNYIVKKEVPGIKYKGITSLKENGIKEYNKINDIIIEKFLNTFR